MVNMCFSDKLLESIHIDLLGMSMLLLINSTNQIYQSLLFRSVRVISNLKNVWFNMFTAICFKFQANYGFNY